MDKDQGAIVLQFIQPEKLQLDLQYSLALTKTFVYEKQLIHRHLFWRAF